MPKNIEGYYQETGRAGRDGLLSNAWMAYGLQDVVQQRRMIDESGADPEHQRIQTGKLDALLGLCEMLTCRRVRLLAYFGEAAQPCGNCDVCLSPPVSINGTVLMQKLLSAIYRVGQRFGAVHVIDVLRGKRTERIEQWRHHDLSVFGIGIGESEGSWRSVLRQAIARGVVTVDPENFNMLKLTALARPILKGEEEVWLRPYEKPEGRKKAVGRKSYTEKTLHADDKGLYERLRWWRMETARQQNVPAYVIFQDTTLKEIAHVRPATLDELAGVSGMGARRLATWGEAVLAIVRADEV
jgi:ATP-dependent DNA helicase RecQ